MVLASRQRIVITALCILLLASVASAVAAAETTGVRWCPLSSDCLEWTPVAGVSAYRVLRGEARTDACLLSPLIDSCIQSSVAEPTTGHSLADAPPAGGLFWYLVTSVEPGSEGPPGNASPGPRTLNASRFCDSGCSDIGEGCDTSADCCGAECVDGTCAADCGADRLGVSMVKSWFDRPIHGDIASPSHLFLNTYDLRKKKLYDLDQRLMNDDGDPSTPPRDASDPGWSYYRQGVLAPGSPVDDSDADHALTFFQTPYRGDLIISFLGTEEGPDVSVAEDSASPEVRDFLAAINAGVVEHTNWLGRIQRIEIFEPPYLEVQGVWQPQGIATVKVTATTSDPNAVRVAEIVLHAVRFPAVTGPLQSCGGIDFITPIKAHWGTISALTDLELQDGAVLLDVRWDSGVPLAPEGSPGFPHAYVDLGVPWIPGGYTQNLGAGGGTILEDPWLSLRTIGLITDAANPYTQPYPTDWEDPDVPPFYGEDRDHSNLIQQDESVTCPGSPYEAWRSVARDGGEQTHYLQWVTDDSFQEGGVVKTFQEWTHNQTGFFFFETIDNNAPDGTNLTPPIIIHGDWAVRGFIYMNAQNFRATGTSGADINMIAPGEPYNDIFTGGPGFTGVYNAEPWVDVDANGIFTPGVDTWTDTIPPANGGTNGVFDAEPWVNLDYDSTMGGGLSPPDHRVVFLPGTETAANTAGGITVTRTTTNMRDADGLPVQNEINLYGVLYNSGAFSAQGNGTYFGSVIAAGGVSEDYFGAPAAGNPSIFFDERLKKGEWPPPELELPLTVSSSLFSADGLPPPQPQNLVACAGQCMGLLLTWDPPLPGEDVDHWEILTGLTPFALGNLTTSFTNEAYVTGLISGAAYFFRVRAVDAWGNSSLLSPLSFPGPLTVEDMTTPSAPDQFDVSGGSGGPLPAEDSLIRLQWSPVTTNVEAIACDPEPYRIRDFDRYRLYRSTAPGPIATPAFLYTEPLPPDSEFVDTVVVACRTYYYDITAVDQCGIESASQPSIQSGYSTTQEVPAQPTGLDVESVGPSLNSLHWDRVTKNSAGLNILVDTYRVYRAELPAGLLPSEAEAAIDWEVEAIRLDVVVSDLTAPSYLDAAAFLNDPANAFYYRVSGLSDCSAPYDEGELSSPREALP